MDELGLEDGLGLELEDELELAVNEAENVGDGENDGDCDATTSVSSDNVIVKDVTNTTITTVGITIAKINAVLRSHFFMFVCC